MIKLDPQELFEGLSEARQSVLNGEPIADPEIEVFHFSFNNPEALRNEIIEMLGEEDEDIAIAEQWEAERLAVCNADNEAEKAEWKAFLDSLPAWQRQWDEAPLRRLKERRDAELSRSDIPVPEGFDEALEEAREQRAQWLEQQKALEREAQSAELSGLMVCGDDEWGRR